MANVDNLVSEGRQGISGEGQGMSYVYFIQNTNTKWIKIGWAINPMQRLKTLQTGSSDILNLIGYFPGRRQDEVRLHHRFMRYRQQGEWFENNDELLTYIPTIPGVRTRLDGLVGMCVDERLDCHVQRMRYDYDGQIGWLEMGDQESCQVTACIDLFKFIDPHVRQIHTVAGVILDAVFLRVDGYEENEGWRVISPLIHMHLPVLGAYETGMAYVVWCRFCERWHIHGKREGHRRCHCVVAQSDYYQAGYMIYRLGAWKIAEKPDERRSPLPRPMISI